NATAGKNPNAADPEQHQRTDEPERFVMLVQCLRIRAIDVQRHDDNSAVAGSGAKTHDEGQISFAITTSVADQLARPARIIELGVSLDETQTEKHEHGECQQPERKWN